MIFSPEPGIYVSPVTGHRLEEFAIEYSGDGEMRWLVDTQTGGVFLYVTGEMASASAQRG
jgi:hypothetical protein